MSRTPGAIWRSVGRWSMMAAACLLVANAAGCYERTVSAKGFGADRVTLSDPNSPEPVKKTKLRQSATHRELPAGRLRVQEQ